MSENIKRLLDRAWEAYDRGNPFMTDADFDALSIKYNYNDYGSEPLGEKATHPYQMMSLKKVFDDEEAPYEIQNPIESPKLDGTAISLVYEEGYLVMALRRGRSGDTEGQVVTDKVSYLVPNQVERTAKHQINGEVVCDKSINNARNYASGAFGIKDINEFISDKLPHLKFVAYAVIPYDSFTYEADMALLHAEGLSTVLERDIDVNYRTDGQVFRENDNNLFEAAGYTSKHPRGAYARKKTSDVAIEQTKLTGVTWQVGRTGQITPVAHFEEIIIDDARITKATLHNAGFIEEMDLDIDDTILVTRSGGIIPKVLGKV
jgi:DNA ligase (NAD+)